MASEQGKSRLTGRIEYNLKPILIVLVAGIVILGLGLRLFDLTDQPIDFHATRQLRNAVVARSIYYHLLPTADEETRQMAVAFANSTGQYEPPFLESIVAASYLILGKEVLWVSRVYTTLFWMIGGLALFDLALRMVRAPSRTAWEQKEQRSSITVISALVPLAYFLVLPFGVQASRSFQPDPGMVMGIILSVYCLYRWSENPSWKWAILAGILSGITILVKVVAAYIVAGAAFVLVLYQSLDRETKLAGLLSILKNPQIWAMVALLLAPTAAYYLSRGARSSEYFSNWTVALSHLLLEPWFYARWLNALQKLMGILPLLLSLVGLLVAKPRARALLLGLWIGYIAYGLFLPYQMTSHSYYHLQLIPIVALSLAPVTHVSLEHLMKLLAGRRISLRVGIVGAVLGVAMAILLYSSWQALVPLYSKDYRSEPAYWQEIAAQLPTDGKIMALTQDYGYRLMYYGWRKVTLWPNRGEQRLIELRGSGKSFEELFAERAEGKSYFLITSFNQFNDQPILKQTLYENYAILAETPGYIIFDLRQPLGSP
jgi:hypothetical protein